MNYSERTSEYASTRSRRFHPGTGLKLTWIGFAIFILGAKADWFGLSANSQKSFLEVATLLIGLGIISIGGLMGLIALWEGASLPIVSDIGVPLVATGYGFGAVNYHTGETVVIIRKRKRRLEVAELLQRLVEKHPQGTIYVASCNASTHQDDDLEAVGRAAAGRLVLLYLPTYSPWLNSIEMLWRHLQREVTHFELFETVKILIEASYNFFRRYNKTPHRVLSIMGIYSS